MSLAKSARYLLDVNMLVALATRNHVHHELVRGWFYGTPDLRWAICAFTEAGFIRIATSVKPSQISMDEAATTLKQFSKHPGYGYYSITEDWHTLTAPFAKRLYGTKQVTDAYLLGIALHDGMVLATMDKALLHLAGVEHRKNVLLLAESSAQA